MTFLQLNKGMSSPSVLSSTSLSSKAMLKISKNMYKSTNFGSMGEPESENDYKLDILSNLAQFEKETRAMLKSDILYIHNATPTNSSAEVLKSSLNLSK